MNEIERLTKRIDAAASTEDWGAGCSACIDYLEWYFRNPAPAETDHASCASRLEQLAYPSVHATNPTKAKQP